MRRLSCVSVEDSCINAPCSHICNPLSDDIYQCECPVGYKLENEDNHNCHNIDECEEESDDCDQECTDTDGSYQCWCRPGYKKSVRLNARTLMNVKRRVMTVIRNVEILTDHTNVGVDQGTKKSIRLNARTLMNVKRRVMTVIRNVQILTDLTNVGVDQGTKKSIRLNARTLMSVPTDVRM